MLDFTVDVFPDCADVEMVCEGGMLGLWIGFGCPVGDDRERIVGMKPLLFGVM